MDQTPAAVPSVEETPAPAPSKVKRVRPSRAGGKRAAAPVDAHLDAMRMHGLVYDGKPDRVFMPPGGRVVPAETMDGPTAAYHVPDRPTLLWLLERGFQMGTPPAAEEKE